MVLFSSIGKIVQADCRHDYFGRGLSYLIDFVMLVVFAISFSKYRVEEILEPG